MIVTVTGQEGRVCEAAYKGHRIRMDQPPEYGGKDTEAEPVIMLAAGLGGCIYASMFPFLERRGLAAEKVAVEVEMAVMDSPKRVGIFSVGVKLPPGVEDKWLSALQRLATSCIVHGTLTNKVEVEVDLERPDRGECVL